MPVIIEDAQSVHRRLARLAWLLDNSIPLAGGRYRIGLDAILGLIPGLGDVIGVIISGYIVREAARAGVPRSVLAHMVFNVAIEGLVGLIPLAGDVFDAAWKANQRNVALLEAHIAEPRRTVRASRWFVAGLLAALFALLVVIVTLAIVIARLLLQALSG